MAPSPVVRAVVEALVRIRRSTGVSLAFAGTVEPDAGLRLSHFDGSTVGALHRVLVDVGQGLGGRVVEVGRPMVVDDYRRTPTITHRYDAIIASEGLRAMAATPVVVAQKPVAVLYAALRTADPIGDRTKDCLADAARTVEQRIVAARTRVSGGEESSEAAALRDRIGDAYAQLRILARSLDDPRAAGAITRISESLIDEVPAHTESDLTAREVDVLALAAIGHGNAHIADLLGVRTDTVKGYMKDAMRKLHAHTRLEAVVLARRLGVLP
ncbi:LuxR C-terminal-related transcriptional regulator [[Mycobacterium] wendilense]|uniref:LuxR C-terminal-related transcriptional regulator n=1 Tax=[Mycobacterium] wendilense TaxID=3064284 RepID=A0ABN9P5C2_9MYCO|nr:LuxR C-terminal-related transcriptional regulator [Mycolicibacterium sp. MU0050]CAJ1587470.1 LuxR C-terminal-related transcriptional regulator [Mycolicibacterium sp. MU0050]